ncbi:hypothetical protein CYMTET_38580 [Cymbomonas tetramitiformis]|uniref:Patatin n=1 Tax=Cymbomonas tetramitiformis TaxID=36881 RepID=A0AAE0CDI2_9CHLO|nr:hypothetical protein CYMTET_38580 [Cymbomonas tetramitiformis]|eukprot:gene26751-32867_t
MSAPAIAFGSSGLLVTYHAGVAQTFSKHKWSRILGVSGGSVIGLLLCVCPEKLCAAEEYMLGKKWAKGITWGDLWDPAGRILPEYLACEGLLPENAYELASGKLRVFCTRVHDRRSVAFDSWASNEELIRTVQASCSFAYSGVVLKDGLAYWDGGMAKDVPLLPTYPGAATVTVSPFSGQGASISPASRGWPRVSTRYGDLSWPNMVRSWDVSVPRSRAVMADYVEQGKSDAKEWAERTSAGPLPVSGGK